MGMVFICMGVLMEDGNLLGMLNLICQAQQSVFSTEMKQDPMYWMENAMNVGQNWLLSMADFEATKRGLDQLARKIIFNLIVERLSCQLLPMCSKACGRMSMR